MASALGSSARKVDRRGGCGGSGSHFPVLPCRFVHSPPRRGAGAGVTCAWRLKFRAVLPPARPPAARDVATTAQAPTDPHIHPSIHSAPPVPHSHATRDFLSAPPPPRDVSRLPPGRPPSPCRCRPWRGRVDHYGWRRGIQLTVGQSVLSHSFDKISSEKELGDCNGSSRSTVMQQEHAHDLCSENVVQKASSWPLTSSDERIISLHSRAREWASDDLDRIEVHMDEIEMKK
ncbi:hypothetical protein GUJ93_ZPchr0014g46865 [Zizania palustris]|uniref:Uncharacterized protein n=1 Tax=Zizania palustris TaxID=103762 RepID=A0A8J5SXZ9_ZIZPA|nr:hypothetical protein GUJ93_ZPchr0014g46865 [Zizania palustris]